MKVKATRAKFFNLMALLQTQGALGKVHRDFAYAAVKTIRKINEELEVYQSLVKGYDEGRFALAKEYAKKDDKGELVVVNNEFQFEGDNRALFEAQLAPAKEQFEGLDKQEVEVHAVPLHLIPESVSVTEMQLLELMLENNDGQATS